MTFIYWYWVNIFKIPINLRDRWRYFLPVGSFLGQSLPGSLLSNAAETGNHVFLSVGCARCREHLLTPVICRFQFFCILFLTTSSLRSGSPTKRVCDTLGMLNMYLLSEWVNKIKARCLEMSIMIDGNLSMCQPALFCPSNKGLKLSLDWNSQLLNWPEIDHIRFLYNSGEIMETFIMP
jgi:hypothetical protein